MTAVALSSGRRAFRGLPLSAAALLAGGVILLTWLAVDLLRSPPEPYNYELEMRGGVADFPELGIESREGASDLNLVRYRVEIPGSDQALAIAYVVQDGQWQPLKTIGGGTQVVAASQL